MNLAAQTRTRLSHLHLFACTYISHQGANATCQKCERLFYFCISGRPRTSEPFVCRADHSITLLPVKFNHPASTERKTNRSRSPANFRNHNWINDNVNDQSNWSHRKCRTCLCAAGNPPVPSYATAETPWAEKKHEVLIIQRHPPSLTDDDPIYFTVK